MEQKTTGEKHQHHPNYLLVFVSLAVLTAIEVVITYVPLLEPVLTPILLVLSFFKAILVILYFMHLRFDSRWYSFIFFVPFLLVIPMIIVLLIS